MVEASARAKPALRTYWSARSKRAAQLDHCRMPVVGRWRIRMDEVAIRRHGFRASLTVSPVRAGFTESLKCRTQSRFFVKIPEIARIPTRKTRKLPIFSVLR